MKRVVTYDIRVGNTYDKFYEFIEKYAGVKITESTYEIDTDLGQTDFEERLKKVFNKGDNVAYITCNNKNGLFYKRVKV